MDIQSDGVGPDNVYTMLEQIWLMFIQYVEQSQFMCIQFAGVEQVYLYTICRS